MLVLLNLSPALPTVLLLDHLLLNPGLKRTSDFWAPAPGQSRCKLPLPPRKLFNNSSPATSLKTRLWRLISGGVLISALTPTPHVPASGASLCFCLGWYLHSDAFAPHSHVVERHQNVSFMSLGSWNHRQNR